MAYPLHVDLEYCHKHHVWYAFHGSDLIAFNRDLDDIKLLFEDHTVIPKRDSALPGSHKGTINDGCRLHYGDKATVLHSMERV